MTTIYASLGSTPIVSGVVTVPRSGIWHADIVLQEPADTSGALTLRLADAEMSCTAIRAIDVAGARGVRVVGGAGGWRRHILARHYGLHARVSMVVSDAASEAGERVEISDTRTLRQYTRRAGPAVWTLHALLGSSWWMGYDGIVRDTTRPSAPITTDWTAIHIDGAAGVCVVATERVSDWTPGRTFYGPTISGTISRVEHRISSGSLRTTVYMA